MASPLTIWPVDTPAATAVATAADIFAATEAQCTRFRVDSALMRLNGRPGEWMVMPALAYTALVTAQRAWRRTGGRFDPRVLDVLVDLGYGEGPPGRRPAGLRPAVAGQAFLERGPRRREVRLLDGPLDLGGIGKGLAVRWAADCMARQSANFLINAGGDCYCAGAGPDGGGWRVGVEDPLGRDPFRAVLAVRDRAVCTSSVRRRTWLRDGQQVHHLIDPRTRAPSRGGLLAVTVVGPDPGWAEVWSKALFIEGAAGIRALADRHGLAAIWVDAAGTLMWNGRLQPYLAWAGVKHLVERG